MVRWYHSIFTAYGFWLPNDPRGSWSDFVASWELLKFGTATKVDTRQSVAGQPHDVSFRRDAKLALKYPPVRFDEYQRACIADAIDWAAGESGVVVRAAHIGFDHVHVVTDRHEKMVERVIGHFKGRATQSMKFNNCHPLEAYGCPTPWAENSWSVYINDEVQLAAAIAYVERHSEKEGLPRQHHPFVTPYFV